jgi:hypothetical protein
MINLKLIKILKRLFSLNKPANNFFEFNVSKSLIHNFIEQAEQKIQVEGWGKQGRNQDIKIKNFVNCWITEEGFKQILIQKNKWFRYRGMYFGDAEGSGPDFTVKKNGKLVGLGIRSISSESLTKWKSVPYPDDRFRNEKDKITDYHIVCSQDKGKVKIYGIISKDVLLKELAMSKIMYSRKNQEYFRVLAFEKFSFAGLKTFIEQLN